MRFYQKMQAGGNRLYSKLRNDGDRLYGKIRSQVIDNPRLLHSVSNGLNQVSNYGEKGLKIGAGLAFGLGQPEVGAVLSAGTAAAGALGHAAHLVDDRANYLERAKRKEKENQTEYH